MSGFQGSVQVSEQVVRDAGFTPTGIELPLVSLTLLMGCFWPTDADRDMREQIQPGAHSKSSVDTESMQPARAGKDRERGWGSEVQEGKSPAQWLGFYRAEKLKSEQHTGHLQRIRHPHC